MVVVLPAPLGPRKPNTSPRRDLQVYAAHRLIGAVSHTEVVDFDRERAHRGGQWYGRRRKGYETRALAPRGAGRLTGTNRGAPNLPWGRGEEHPMQLDQQPRPGPSAEPDLDRTSDTPTLRSAPIASARPFGLAAAIARAARRQLADRHRVLRRQPHRARRRRRPRSIVRSPDALQYAAHGAGRARLRARVRGGRARRRGRHLRRARAARPPARRQARPRASGSTLARIAGLARACGRCRRRPRRRGCAAAATARPATRPRSRTTTTSRTTSTASCSGPR